MRSGNSYEREAIVEHLQQRGQATDPVTNAPLASLYAIPNWQLRRDVQAFLEAHPDYTPAGWADRTVPPTLATHAILGRLKAGAVAVLLGSPCSCRRPCVGSSQSSVCAACSYRLGQWNLGGGSLKAVERVCQALLVIAQKRGFTLSDVSEMFSYRKQRLSPFLPRRGQKSYGMRFRIPSPPATSQLARLQEARPEATLQRPGTLATLDSDEEVATLGFQLSLESEVCSLLP